MKLREKILFFDEVILYEDELDDNGCAVLSSKIVSDKKLEHKDCIATGIICTDAK